MQCSTTLVHAFTNLTQYDTNTKEREIKFFACQWWNICTDSYVKSRSATEKQILKASNMHMPNFTFWRVLIPMILPVIHLKTTTSNFQILRNNDSPVVIGPSKQYMTSEVTSLWRLMLWSSELCTTLCSLVGGYQHNRLHCHYRADCNINITCDWHVINFHLLKIVTFNNTQFQCHLQKNDPHGS